MKTRTELENELKLLESGAAAIREQLAAMPKQWEPEGGGWYVSSGGTVRYYDSSRDCKMFGTERKTRESAERAAIEMRKFNRLLAYRDEFAPGYEPDWNDETEKTYVFQARTSGKYQVADNMQCQTLGAVYMPVDVANSLCLKLNSGEVVL